MTVAFLFTDLEGSTRLWRSYPDRMPAAYARHDAILRNAVAAHGGTIYKTVGDAIQAAFPSIGQAVAAAADAQRALVKSLWPTPEPIRVRIALHAGDVAPDESGDYRSPVLNRLGRLLDAAHGGQVLLSADAVQLVKQAELPPGVELRDLGRHRLKDLGRPETLYQVVAPGLPVVFPRPRTAPSPWTGIGAAVALALMILLLSPIVTGAAEVEPASFTPRSVVENLTGVVIALAAVRDHVLLAFTAAAIAATVVAAFIWWRGARVRPGAWGGVLRLAGRAVGPRTVGFLLGVTCLLAGTYAYQQYLWRVALPIPAGRLGVALTREAAAVSFDEELALLLSDNGASDVVVRELPVGFDASDVDVARKLGRRIAADVVLIYREDSTDPAGRYVAYVVFTDPDLGWVVSTTSAGQGEVVTAVQSEAGIEVPTLRAGTIDGVFAVLVYMAAGVVAYHDNDVSHAISHLERARVADPDGANAGLIDFYLGSAYDRTNRDAAASSAYERGLDRYERRREAGERLSPQDLLLVARMVWARGSLAAVYGDFDAAIRWYERGAALYRDMEDLAGGTVRPEDIRLAFAHIFADLADAYRLKQDPDLEKRWAARAEEELLAAASIAGDPGAPRFAVEEANVRLTLGDCVQAQAVAQQALQRDPDSFDAHFVAFHIHRFAAQQHLAAGQLERLIAARPDDVRGRLLLARYLNGGYGINDWTWLASGIDEAEVLLREVVEREPTDAQVRWTLAWTLYVKAIVSNTAVWPGEQLGDSIAVAREQLTGRMTADQQRALVDALGLAIDQGKVAVELGPDEPWSHFGLLRAYQERRRALAGVLGIEPLIMSNWRGSWQDAIERSRAKTSSPTAEPPRNGTATIPPDLVMDVERLVADDAQVLEEVDWFLATGGSAPLTHRVEAWHQKLSVLGTEWRLWQRYGDQSARTAALNMYRRAIGEALTFAGAISAQDAGLSNLPVLYSAIEVAAKDLGMKSETDAARYGLGTSTTALNRAKAGGYNNDGAYVRHWATLCDEMKDHWHGRDQARDSAGALAAYKAALAINPDNVIAQWDYAQTAYQQGDLATAIEWGTKAAHPDPRTLGNGIAWLTLALYQSAAGDRAASDATYDHYFATMSALPVWTWGIEIAGWGIDEIGLMTRMRFYPDHEAGAAFERIAVALGQIAERATGADAAWCAYLLAKSGASLIEEGNPIAGEAALRQSLALEEHQPVARAMLALAVLLQGRDASAEIEAAIDEAFDPFWSSGPPVIVSSPALIRAMSAEVQRNLADHMNDSSLAAPLTDALKQAAERPAEPSGAPRQ